MAATLIVGLGGIGSKVTMKICERAEAEGLDGVEFVVMDTDVNDLRTIRNEKPRIFTVQTSPSGTVGAALDQNHYARDLWFPVNDGLTGKPFTEGAGQVRAVSRLAFDHALEQGFMSELEKAIEKLHGISGETLRQEMRIMIVGSNNGGTGSGIILPVAMYIRNFLITRYQDNSAIIRGFFLEPDTIFDRIIDEEERNSLRCNAYATVREIDAFFRKEYSGDSDEFRHVVFNAPQPGSGERVDYPNILPYQYIFLMDAINSEGEHLKNHEAYLDHAADCVYAQALSAVAARSNSSEDNIIRNLAANNGRSRYCGAGSAYLKYPKDDVQTYLGLKWASGNISTEWLEIDDEYEQKHREDSELKLRDYYLTTFASKMDIVPFYDKISRNHVKKTFEDLSGGTEIIEPAREFPDYVSEHAVAVNEGELKKSCTEMQRLLNMIQDNPIPVTAEQIEDLVETDGAPALSSIAIDYERFYDRISRYNQAVTEEVAKKARSLAESAYSVSDYNDRPLVTNAAKWHVESFLRVDNEGLLGCVHPGTARYLLFQASQEIEGRIQDCDTAVSQYEAQINAIQKKMEREAEEDDTSESAEKPKRKMSFSFGRDKNAVDEDAVNKMVDTAKDLKRFQKMVDNRRATIVERAFLVAAKKYVDKLSNAYAGFYSYLKGQIGVIDSRIRAIENDSSMNAAKGSTRKYVCANSKCLKKLSDECPVKGDSAELPVDLCADIYHSLLRFTKLADRDVSNDVKNRAFSGLFQSTILDYWSNRVLDPNMGYPHKVDMNIAQAIAAEARYMSEKSFLDKSEENEYVNHYMADVFDQAFHLAAPFIEPPVGEMPRTFKTCAYDESILDDAGAYYDTLEMKLSQYNGTKIAAGHYSKHTIMFYRSMYGFCAENLPKYAPARDGLQPMPEGEYHHAYFMLINQLSPNLKENRLITPHIDRNWHLVTALPDLNENNEKKIKKDIVRAYIYGLIFQCFGIEPLATGEDIFYLESTSTHNRTDLWVSNGTPCDRFYEVFDAMKYSPRAVYMLISRSNKRMAQEKNEGSIGLSVENCKLLRRVRSKAFVNDFDERMADVLMRIKSFVAENRTDEQRAEQAIDNLPSTLVTNMFNLGQDDDESRRSILEIPLFYRISLPHSELRSGEIEDMIESIFGIVREHLSNFSSGMDLTEQCERFFEEQYILFERNLIKTERMCPNTYAERTVSAVREKTLSFVEGTNRRHDRMVDFKNRVVDVWNTYRR